MREKIELELERIEKENDVKILFAVESGSRAWGFPSKDSDYDVRFVYIHPVEWYLSIHDKRDVIEYPISDDLDISGWDIKRRCNYSRSRTQLYLSGFDTNFYSKNSNFPELLQQMSEKNFDPKATIYHYLHMASKNYREFLQGENVKLKKYFYVLRPILACKWLEEKATLPPVEFDRLITELPLERSVLDEIEKLLIKKKAGTELDVGLKIKVLNQFLEEQIHYYGQYVKGIEKGSGSILKF